MAEMMQLRKTELPVYDDVRQIYANFGWSFKPKTGPRVALQDVEYDWLAASNLTVSLRLKQRMPHLSNEEALEVVKKARVVRSCAIHLVGKFASAVISHSRGNLDETIDALRAAEIVEKSMWEDESSPLTKCLRAELLIAVPDVQQ